MTEQELGIWWKNNINYYIVSWGCVLIVLLTIISAVCGVWRRLKEKWGKRGHK